MYSNSNSRQIYGSTFSQLSTSLFIRISDPFNPVPDILRLLSYLVDFVSNSQLECKAFAEEVGYEINFTGNRMNGSTCESRRDAT